MRHVSISLVHVTALDRNDMSQYCTWLSTSEKLRAASVAEMVLSRIHAASSDYLIPKSTKTLRCKLPMGAGALCARVHAFFLVELRGDELRCRDWRLRRHSVRISRPILRRSRHVRWQPSRTAILDAPHGRVAAADGARRPGAAARHGSGARDCGWIRRTASASSRRRKVEIGEHRCLRCRCAFHPVLQRTMSPAAPEGK